MGPFCAARRQASILSIELQYRSQGGKFSIFRSFESHDFAILHYLSFKQPFMEKKVKNVFVEGAISPEFIANSIAKHQSKVQIGAHDIFLGQVRADEINDKKVGAIDYTAYEEMANLKFHEIREETFEKFNLSCMHIYHSLGTVPVGKICLFVFVSSPHRKEVFKALQHVVEEIKSKVPVFGKELFEDDSYQWKINT